MSQSRTDRFHQTLLSIEDQIINGSFSEAARMLREVCRGRVPKQHRALTAQLCRRAYLPELSIRLLYRVVRTRGGRLAEGATLFEKREYACALNNIGAVQEGYRILSELAPTGDPTVHLFLSFYHMERWDWASAIDVFYQLRKKTSSEHGELAVLLNLGTSLMLGPEDLPGATVLFQSVIERTDKDRYRVHHGRALLQLGLCHVLAHKDAAAEKVAARLESVAEHGNDPEVRIGLTQLRALLELRRTGSPAARIALSTVCDDFRSIKAWELVRLCDYLAARVRPDAEVLRRLYHGSPYPVLREKLRTLAKDLDDHEDGFDFTGDLANPGARRIALDVGTGQTSSEKTFLKEGQLLHQLALALTRDLYRPPRVEELREALFPDDVYRPKQSGYAVRRAISRFRQWTRQAKLPLVLREDGGFYRLEPETGWAIRVREPLRPKTATKVPGDLRANCQVLLKRFKHASFTASDAADALKVSGRSARLYLKKAQALGWVEKSGGGPASAYRVTLTV